jgi:hypothetical protein
VGGGTFYIPAAHAIPGPNLISFDLKTRVAVHDGWRPCRRDGLVLSGTVTAPAGTGKRVARGSQSLAFSY